MGVFLTDRLTGEVYGLPNLLWVLLGQSLAALGAPQFDEAFVRDGYVPSWLARTWAGLLFDGLGDLVVVCRPPTGHGAGRAAGHPAGHLVDRRAGQGAELRPVGVYRQGSPAGLSWARHGEQLSVYDLPCAPVVLGYAQFCTAGTGHTATTLRPAAAGTPVSDVAARVLRVRSGLFPAVAPEWRTRRPRESRTA